MMMEETLFAKETTREEMLEDLYAYLFLTHKDCNGHVVVGFVLLDCDMMAVKYQLGAAVPYYGGQPAAEEAE
jgi:carboxymethylenebutenolidase